MSKKKTKKSEAKLDDNQTMAQFLFYFHPAVPAEEMLYYLRTEKNIHKNLKSATGRRFFWEKQLGTLHTNVKETGSLLPEMVKCLEFFEKNMQNFTTNSTIKQTFYKLLPTFAHQIEQFYLISKHLQATTTVNQKRISHYPPRIIKYFESLHTQITRKTNKFKTKEGAIDKTDIKTYKKQLQDLREFMFIRVKAYNFLHDMLVAQNAKAPLENIRQMRAMLDMNPDRPFESYSKTIAMLSNLPSVFHCYRPESAYSMTQEWPNLVPINKKNIQQQDLRHAEYHWLLLLQNLSLDQMLSLTKYDTKGKDFHSQKKIQEFLEGPAITNTHKAMRDSHIDLTKINKPSYYPHKITDTDLRDHIDPSVKFLLLVLQARNHLTQPKDGGGIEYKAGAFEGLNGLIVRCYQQLEMMLDIIEKHGNIMGVRSIESSLPHLLTGSQPCARFMSLLGSQGGYEIILKAGIVKDPIKKLITGDDLNRSIPFIEQFLRFETYKAQQFLDGKEHINEKGLKLGLTAEKTVNAIATTQYLVSQFYLHMLTPRSQKSETAFYIARALLNYGAVIKDLVRTNKLLPSDSSNSSNKENPLAQEANHFVTQVLPQWVNTSANFIAHGMKKSELAQVSAGKKGKKKKKKQRTTLNHSQQKAILIATLIDNAISCCQLKVAHNLARNYRTITLQYYPQNKTSPLNTLLSLRNISKDKFYDPLLNFLLLFTGHKYKGKTHHQTILHQAVYKVAAGEWDNSKVKTMLDNTNSKQLIAHRSSSGTVFHLITSQVGKITLQLTKTNTSRQQFIPESLNDIPPTQGDVNLMLKKLKDLLQLYQAYTKVYRDLHEQKSPNDLKVKSIYPANNLELLYQLNENKQIKNKQVNGIIDGWINTVPKRTYSSGLRLKNMSTNFFGFGNNPPTIIRPLKEKEEEVKKKNEKPEVEEEESGEEEEEEGEEEKQGHEVNLTKKQLVRPKPEKQATNHSPQGSLFGRKKKKEEAKTSNPKKINYDSDNKEDLDDNLSMDSI